MTVEMKMTEVEVPGQVFVVQVVRGENITIQHLLVLCQEEYNKLGNKKHPKIKIKLIRVMTVEIVMMRRKMMMIWMAEEARMTPQIHQGVYVIYINS
jgi:hypothetical protein